MAGRQYVVFGWLREIASLVPERPLPAEITPTDRHILMTLAIFMDNETGEAYPSLTRLEAATGRKRDTIVATTKRAERLGYLDIAHGGIRRKGSKGEQLVPNHYRAKSPYGDLLSPPAGAGKSPSGVAVSPSTGTGTTKELSKNFGWAVSGKDTDGSAWSTPVLENEAEIEVWRTDMQQRGYTDIRVEVVA